MAFPFIPVIIGIGIVYMSGGYSKKYNKKKKEDKSLEDLLEEAEELGLPVIVWGDVENCTDWFVTANWITEIAQPRFDEWRAVIEDDAELQGLSGEEQVHHATYALLEGQLPANCPEPEGDVFLLQVDYPDQPNYYDGSLSVVYLYQDVNNAVGWAFDDIEGGGPGLLYPAA